MIELGLLGVLPLLTLALAASYQYWRAFQEETYFEGFTTLITVAAALVSVLALALAAYAVIDRKRAYADTEITRVEQHAGALQQRLAEQTGEIELLAAMREVGLIVSREVDFEKILASVLEVVAGIFESESITIYLAENTEASSGPAILIPKAHYEGNKISFGDKLPDVIDENRRLPVRK